MRLNLSLPCAALLTGIWSAPIDARGIYSTLVDKWGRALLQ